MEIENTYDYMTIFGFARVRSELFLDLCIKAIFDMRLILDLHQVVDYGKLAIALLWLLLPLVRLDDAVMGLNYFKLLVGIGIRIAPLYVLIEFALVLD
jgi:hypothetical protein